MRSFICWLLGRHKTVSVISDDYRHLYDYCERCGGKWPPGAIL